MDLSLVGNAIDLLGRDVQYRRTLPGSYNVETGRYVPGSSTNTTIQAVIQGTETLSDTPGGAAVEGDAVIWTRADIGIGRLDDGTPPDEIVDGTEVYVLTKGKRRVEGGFYRGELRIVKDQGRAVHS